MKLIKCLTKKEKIFTFFEAFSFALFASIVPSLTSADKPNSISFFLSFSIGATIVDTLYFKKDPNILRDGLNFLIAGMIGFLVDKGAKALLARYKSKISKSQRNNVSKQLTTVIGILVANPDIRKKIGDFVSSTFMNIITKVLYQY